MSVQSALHKVADALGLSSLHDEIDADDTTVKAEDSGEEETTSA